MKHLDLTQDRSARIERRDISGGPVDVVRGIICDVQERGDEALFELTQRFDGAKLDSLIVTTEEIDAAFANTQEATIEALREMKSRIALFAEHQALKPWRAEVGGGIVGEVVSPVRTAGIYVPGGRAVYPSSVLMGAVPAKVAGVARVVLCVPPAADGSVPDATLAAARIAEVTDVFKVGGAQAIAAMAFGTETIPKVDVIAGPGNIYVALAKREVSGTVGIDAVAGPSEIAIVADGSADPSMIAIDIIAQAEHGPDGAFCLVTWSKDLAADFERVLENMLDELSASDHLRSAVNEGTTVAIVKDLEQAVQVINDFAPEHLELIFEGASGTEALFGYAGAIFIGQYSPVPLGDYMAGTNHVLPTAGAAAWASGLRASHFQKTSAVIEHSKHSLERAASHIEQLASVEGLPIHHEAVKRRSPDVLQ
ncbi:MAG: histidinol dehydrogenase [Actinomycetota bacterium]|nr:histidinol dehydrogenase [Actinomycetota bacterium]